MSNLKDILQNRIDKIATPDPTIIIYNGTKYYITDNGEQGSKKDVSVKLSVKFREQQMRQLKPPLGWVFLCIALHINEEGKAWPSIAKICLETGYNKDTVVKSLRKLEFMGFISRVQAINQKTGKFLSNIYQLFPKSKKYKEK